MNTLKSFLFILLISCSGLLHAAPVNINTADAETLSNQLSGIGQNKAAAIVAYREQYGPYKQIADLANVKGIGASTIEKNRSKLAIK